MGSFYGLWTRDGDGAFHVRKISDDYFEIGPVVKASRDGAALALACQTTADYFAFARCEGGQVRRELGYDGSDGWSTVEGEPEAWEAEILFSASERARMRELLEDEPDRLLEVDELFAAGRLVAGRAIPIIDAYGLVRAVMRWYGLPEQ
ncbi:MAG: hypothetical protein MUF10_10875 [Thermoanaerobaculaceae bacterium]|nr:hypothetical protein [Thermoanaerobaculaceae bacterium]